MPKKLNKGHFILVGLIAVGLFMIANLATYAYFANRTYPSTKLGTADAGSKSFSSVEEMRASDVAPETFTLSAGEKKATIKLSDLGASLDSKNTVASIKSARSILPVYNLLKTHQVRPALAFNDSKIKKAAETMSPKLSKPPLDAKITLQDNLFELSPSAEGTAVEPPQIIAALKIAARGGRPVITLSPKKTDPQVTTEQLDQTYQSLQKQQNTALVFSYGQKSASVSPKTIGSWYVQQNGSYTLSDSHIRSYLKQLGSGWGIGIENLEAAVSDTKKALQSSQKLSLTLVAKKLLRTYRYCTAVRGVNSSQLAAFNAKLASVYANSSGWSLEGQVAFERADSGCNFTAWLSAASQMTSFGGVCDSTWSCRSGNNVIINFERWQNASPAWNSGGGSLEDYRVMVINHETGHWLGFGHLGCNAAGQLAPVMQQQSIDLQGCRFNPWPLASELAAFRSRVSG